MDVKCAFLNGPLDDDDFVAQHLDFEVKTMNQRCIDCEKLSME